ncbi:excalibur calcium-binding domain-containing protein [Mesorhizobium qingshengii]|uniref:Excalibur calcium-binding domain-containing protein n=1 Tax=Mesorhizobium qingshengii TaxID=1165689 RepID=A0ABT4R3R6_9HYPH|nr:thermonuclease family protein [Mesorhizobium qingshengii]MCZ8548478.1 excalibur calcium-binding domain-containing protein [Mesorhizobium qingshengii]
MDKYPQDNWSDDKRKRRGVQRQRALLPGAIPKRLVFMAVAAMAAYVTQVVVQHSESATDLNASPWVGRTPEPIVGVASVIDGDTIEVRGQRIRFNGIDAPESAQQCEHANGVRYQCGAKAAAVLDAFLAASRPLHCEFVSWDRYGRFVGDCRRADGASVAVWMVEHGQALDWPRYSHGAYAAQQSKAEAAKVGLWAGTSQAPWDWRAGQVDGTPSRQRLGLVGRQVAQTYSCQPRRTCSQISACDEANWYLVNCPWGGKLDRDKDGIPCESLC